VQQKAQQIDLSSVHFIADGNGNKQAAVLPISLYHDLLAFKALLPESNKHEQSHFSFEVKGIKAFGFPKGSAEKPLFIVKKDSWAIANEASSLRAGIQSLRNDLLNTGILKQVDANYQFQEDYEFNSPSMAACLIAGNARSGMDAWLNTKGQSLKACGYGK